MAVDLIEQLAVAKRLVTQLLKDNDLLRDELTECYAETISNEGYLVDSGCMKGWYDSMAKGNVKYAGDRLVDLGLWERHPDGTGRRWFYRPIDNQLERSDHE